METKKAVKQLKILKSFGKEMQLAAEEWNSDFQILISIIMSARTRDETTIPTAENLFKKYPTVKKLASANLKNIQALIKPVNFYKNKSRNILNCAKVIMKKFKGKVPSDFHALISLPGVGRKTANVFLVEIGKDSIGVDTHVSYISQKLGWTSNKNPEKIEYDLKKLFPKNQWKNVNSTLVRFGKTYTSRKNKDELLKKIRNFKI